MKGQAQDFSVVTMMPCVLRRRGYQPVRRRHNALAQMLATTGALRTSRLRAGIAAPLLPVIEGLA
jgi:hypothetical protein